VKASQRTGGLALLSFIALVLACIVLGLSSREPVYQGRLLSSWLRDLRDPSALTRHRAQEAVRQMGTNAVPTLRGVLHVEDSAFKTNLWALLERQSLLKVSFLRARERRVSAAEACVVLGAEAKIAIPDLVEFSKGDSFCFNLAESALGSMGQAAVPRLSLALTDRSYDMRRLAAGALAAMGPAAQEAAPALTERLKDDYASVRSTAARALFRIGLPSHPAMRGLAQLLSDPDKDVQIMAAVSLEKLGRGAEPILFELANDPEEKVRLGAKAILRAIRDNPQPRP